MASTTGESFGAAKSRAMTGITGMGTGTVKMTHLRSGLIETHKFARRLLGSPNEFIRIWMFGRLSVVWDTDRPAKDIATQGKEPGHGEAFERFSIGLDYSNRDEMEAGFRAGWEAAQRPPVSPEVREALVDTLTSPVRAPGSVAASRVFRAETPEDLEDATALADAILARFSLPVLDAEKVARFIQNLRDANAYPSPGREPSAFVREWAAALVAAIENGELT